MKIGISPMISIPRSLQYCFSELPLPEKHELNEFLIQHFLRVRAALPDPTLSRPLRSWLLQRCKFRERIQPRSRSGTEVRRNSCGAAGLRFLKRNRAPLSSGALSLKRNHRFEIDFGAGFRQRCSEDLLREQPCSTRDWRLISRGLPALLEYAW